MSSRAGVHIVITILGILLFLPFLGLQPLFDWDEINFAESAREMLVSENYGQVQIAYEPFWEKPPLFIWMQAAAMKIFGVNEFAARLPNGICGIATLNILYHLGCKVRNHFTGIFWVVAYAASLAPALYFRSGIIDPVFNLFIFVAVWNLFQAENAIAEKDNPKWNMLLVGFFVGVAVLTKGPVALLLVFIIWIIRIILNPKQAWSGWAAVFICGLTFCLTISIWIIPEWIKHGDWFFQEFLKYQVVLAKGQIEAHNQPWFYHIIVLLFFCFPASVFALPQLFRSTEISGKPRLWSAYMRGLFWTVLIVFSLVTTKIIHYSSLCWLPLGWFAGNMLYRKHTLRGSFPRWILIPYTLVIIVIGVATTIIPIVITNAHWRNMLSANIKDAMAVASLRENAHWQGWEWIAGVFLLLTGIVWIFRFKVMQGHWPFTFASIFGIMFSALLLPKAEKSLQGAYIQELRKLSGKDIYAESWAYKTYAIYFYTRVSPDKFVGKWNKDLDNYENFPNPNTQARLVSLMTKTQNKPVYIFTKISFDPDPGFLERFRKVKNLGPYVLWIRKVEQ